MFKLNCPGNKIELLDVSNNKNLQYLYCDSNQISSIELGENTVLSSLVCNNNNLTSLDISRNTALTRLRCSGNRFKSIDVSNNEKLQNIECDYNHITSLDLSRNTALTNLSCTRNPLTSLDLSQTSVSKLNADQTNKEYAYRAVIREGKFDLSTLSGFDVSKASDWTNVQLDGNIITVTDFSEPVTYKYDTGKGIASFMMIATLAGDANLDGKVDVRDCAYIARMLAAGKGNELPDSADFNDDGKTDVRDAAAIARFLAKNHKNN